MKKGTAAGLVGLFYCVCLAIITFITHKPPRLESNRHTHSTGFDIGYYETTLIINYKDGIKDTTKLNIFQREDNFEVTDGNFSYWKPIKSGSEKVTVASYVRSVEIVESILHPDTFTYDCWAEHK